MKRLKNLTIILLLIAMLPAQLFPVNATTENTETIYLDDGSYITITMCIYETRSNDKTASKTAVHTTAQGIELWSATLTATFTFDGTEYWTTASSIDTEILNDSWYLISQSATHSGCGATGNVSMGKKFLGVTVNKESVTITLSCSPYGVIT